MNWKQRRNIEKRLHAIEHVQTCEKERCSTCSRMLTADKLIALARDTRNVLAMYDAAFAELRERMSNGM
jgi:ferredoxin